MVQPSILLAGAVTVMGKPALPTAMELLLPLEAGVAHKVHEAGNRGRTHVIEVGEHHGTGPLGGEGSGTGSVGHPCLSKPQTCTFQNEGLGLPKSLLAVTILLADIVK